MPSPPVWFYPIPEYASIGDTPLPTVIAGHKMCCVKHILRGVCGPFTAHVTHEIFKPFWFTFVALYMQGPTEEGYVPKALVFKSEIVVFMAFSKDLGILFPISAQTNYDQYRLMNTGIPIK